MGQISDTERIEFLESLGRTGWAWRFSEHFGRVHIVTTYQEPGWPTFRDAIDNALAISDVEEKKVPVRFRVVGSFSDGKPFRSQKTFDTAAQAYYWGKENLAGRDYIKGWVDAPDNIEEQSEESEI